MRRNRRSPATTPDERVQERLNRQEAASEKWRGDTGWTSPGLNAPFTNSGPNVRYRRDPYGNVWVQGYVNLNAAGSGSTIFTLPAGFRPSATVRFMAGGATGTTATALDVQAGGGVLVFYSGAPTIFALDPIHFPAEA